MLSFKANVRCDARQNTPSKRVKNLVFGRTQSQDRFYEARTLEKTITLDHDEEDSHADS